MSIIILLILPLFVINLFKLKIKIPFFGNIDFFLKESRNEYIIISGFQKSYVFRVNIKTDNYTIIDERSFVDQIMNFMKMGNNINVYTFPFYSIIENNGKTNKIQLNSIFRGDFADQVYSGNSLLICSYNYNVSEFSVIKYDIQLSLLKEPYNEIFKILTIESGLYTLFSINNYFIQLIGLKDIFVFILIDEKLQQKEATCIYKIFDLNLNLINSLTTKIENYTYIKFSELSENNKINEFIIFIKYYKSDVKCQIIKYENSNLIFFEPYSIFSQKEIDDGDVDEYYLSINLFNEDKIGCYLYTHYYKYNYDYITILQYENKKLFYYKNIKDISIPSIQFYDSSKKITIVMTEQGIGMLTSFVINYFYYLSSICVTKTISLYNNLLSEFPIKEFIIPGIDKLEFSFEKIDKGLTIYKNSTEIKIGQIFHDLNNFTYILKIDAYFKDSFSIKVKNNEFGYICDIKINIISNTNISTYKESQKCFKNKDYDNINNITYSNLFDYFNINNKNFIQFEFIMEYEPKGNELIFYFNNYTLNCYKNYTQIICKAPLIIFPKLEKLHLYSYLSCYNLIDVGWFEINDVNIYSIYSLINYNFDNISEMYEPSEKIIEYNPIIINYYYWFSCFSYCDDKNIEQNNCCNNILNKWEVVFHKEYIYDKEIIDLIIDLFAEVCSKYNIRDDFDLGNYITDLIGDSSSNLGKIYKKSKDGIEANSILIPLFEYLSNLVYQYNFVILKNDEYKKIVVAFPGITYYFQLIEEFIHAGMVELPIKSEKKVFNVLEMYYNIFTKIEDDLFDNLKGLPGVMNKDYQVIFVGHSLGGAIATISSFYYIKKYNFTAENILITFGQPKVGSEIFARELTSNLKQIYRIARPKDIATLFPYKGIDFFFKYIKTIKLLVEVVEFLGNFLYGNGLGAAISLYNFFINFKDIEAEYSFLFHDTSIQDNLYSHIGGLYMIDDDTNRVYHCDDFFNEKRYHFMCKNHNMKYSLSIISDFFHYRKYLSTNQDMINSCQKKKLEIFRLSIAAINKQLRRLEIAHKNKQYNYNIQRNRKLDNIQNIQEILKLFEEKNLKKKNFEYCYKYQSKEIIKKNDLILIINPKNNHFFGEICFSLNITWIINNKFNSMNCYFINIKNPFALKIEIEKEIIDEKELYIYIKGKISGTLELYDLTKNKALNISSSYFIPYIDNFDSKHNINFILPKIEEDIYINIIINDFGFTENKNISSIFEVYKDKKSINYEKNNLILEKDKEYYFKYYPNQYELIINFIPIYSNKFLEKKFYFINEQNISINYNIESINNNQVFGLFFDFNGVINIKGYFSNISENQDNFKDYTLNSNNKYCILTKNNRFKYFKLDINVNSGLTSEFIIYDIKEVIIINKINSIYNINKTKNYILFLDEITQKNYAKFESYILISINNHNNILKLLLSNGNIISSKNYILIKLFDIKGIFIKANEDDIFMIKIIPEEVSKYINEESSTYFGNTFIDDKKYSIEFIHTNEELYAFYNTISTNLKIYELNNGSYFQLEDIINNNINNYSLLLGLKTLEEKKTHIIFKEASGPFLYEKYINNLIIDLNYILDISKICYLLMDFEYNFSYNKKMKKILLKVLNNENKQTSIKIKCENEVIEVKDNIHLLNVEKCNGTFLMSGNNSLIYFYLPLTLNDSNTVIENKDNFELLNIAQFFFVPTKNDFNSINFLLTLDYKPNNYPVYITYYIEYGTIPYSRNIQKKHILITNETNIIIPNYSNFSKGNEKYFLFFKFNTTISKLNSKIVYENIIYLDDQLYLFLKSGIHTIKFTRDIDYYLNLTKFNKNKDNSFYIIYKNERNVEKQKISDSGNIIYIPEPSYNENIKLKIENEDDVFLCVSSENFQDFSSITYNTNLDIEQIENILIIKFNSTNYNSKLEYQIALIDEEDNLDPISIHKKFLDNDLIYKNIIYSIGNEQIEANISLKNNFIYNKNYTVIGYGKDIYGEIFNYFYFVPKTFFIIEPKVARTDKVTDNIIFEPNTTYIVEDTDNIDNYTDIIDKDKNEKGEKSSSVIFIIVLAFIIIIGGIIFGLSFC